MARADLSPLDRYPWLKQAGAPSVLPDATPENWNSGVPSLLPNFDKTTVPEMSYANPATGQNDTFTRKIDTSGLPTRSDWDYRMPAQAKGDPRSIVNPFLSQTYSPHWLDDVIAALNQGGVTSKRATRAGGVLSDDKVDIGNGRILDLIGDVGGANTLQYIDESEGGGSPTSGVAGQMFDDPATQMFQSLILDRIDKLLNSVNRPDDDRYRTAALSRVDELMKDPYSQADEQALITRMRDPLTQARDARMSAAKERLGARNIGPSSGLFEEQVYNAPNRDYERALAGGTNDLAVQGIQEKQRRLDTALNTLGQLVGLGKDQRGEDEGRAREALTTGAILPDLSERRLQLMLQSLGLSNSQTGSLMSSLLQLSGQQQNQSQFDAAQKQQQAEFWGSMIARLATVLGG